MTDAARDDIATITLSEHSRLLIASHRAMRADGRRLITAHACTIAGRAMHSPSVEPSPRS